MLSTTLVIIKWSVDIIENSKRFNLILVSCIRIIYLHKVYRVFHKFCQKINQNFLNFKKINTSKNKQFTKINTLKIHIFFDSHEKISTPRLVVLNVCFMILELIFMTLNFNHKILTISEILG